jgi:hypothetical protein
VSLDIPSPETCLRLCQCDLEAQFGCFLSEELDLLLTISVLAGERLVGNTAKSWEVALPDNWITKFVRLSHIGGATLAVKAVMLNSSLPNLNKNTEVGPVVRKMK